MRGQRGFVKVAAGALSGSGHAKRRSIMIAVIFEVLPRAGCMEAYLGAAASLRPQLERMDGFISIERFQSLSQPGKLLSLSFWRDEEAVAQWRKLAEHRAMQRAGRDDWFADYRLHVVSVMRDYGMSDRAQAPDDSIAALG